MGQTLSGSFAFEQVTNAAGEKIVRVGIADVSLSLAGGLVTRQPGQRPLRAHAGRRRGDDLRGRRRRVPGVSFGGSFALSINNTSTAVAAELQGRRGDALAEPARPGPTCGSKAPASGSTVLGQRLTGDFSVEQITIGRGTDGLPGTADDERAVKIAIANASLSLGDGSKNFLTLTNGSGQFLIVDTNGPTTAGGARRPAERDGRAAERAGRLALRRPQLELNTTNTEVDETFVVGGFPTQLHLDTGNYVRVSGSGVQLTVAGQRLSGNFTFERDTTVPTAPVVRVTFSDVELGLGDGTTDFVRVTDASGQLTLTSAGIYGRFAASVAVDVPGVTVHRLLHGEAEHDCERRRA